MIAEYDPKTCWTAGELRGLGFGIPHPIPDCAWVAKSDVVFDSAILDGKHERELEVNFSLKFNAPFNWIDVDVIVTKKESNNMKIVILAGAGGTGKTTITNAMKAKYPWCEVMPSITRAVYAKMGIATEQQGIALNKDQIHEFQGLIYTTYLETVDNLANMEARKGTKLLVIDRSPYDYVSYQISVMPEMTLEHLQGLIRRADEFMDNLAKANKAELLCWYLPFPAPWTDQEGNSSDEIRYAPAGKNYTWDSILQRLLQVNIRDAYVPANPVNKFLHLTSHTVEDRLLEIADVLERVHE